MTITHAHTAATTPYVHKKAKVKDRKEGPHGAALDCLFQTIVRLHTVLALVSQYTLQPLPWPFTAPSCPCRALFHRTTCLQFATESVPETVWRADFAATRAKVQTVLSIMEHKCTVGPDGRRSSLAHHSSKAGHNHTPHITHHKFTQVRPLVAVHASRTALMS
jgi:hypothetical protein